VAYVGNQPARGQWRKLSDISSAFDGVITTFTTSVPPGTSEYFVTAGSASQLLISLGGVIQEPDVDYTVSTNSVTFTTPPTSGLSFFGVLCGDALNTGVPADGSVTTSKLAGGLSVGLTGGSASNPSLFFTGDNNTGVFSAGADQLNIATNSVERVEFGTSEVVFNDGGANYDFRIEGDTNSSLFFVDASADAVGIGTTSPSNELHIASASNSIGPLVRFQNTGTTSPATGYVGLDNNNVFISADSGGGIVSFRTGGGSEKARIDPFGRLLVGTSTARGNFYNSTVSAGFQLEGTGTNRRAAVIGDDFEGVLILASQKSGAVGGNTVLASGDPIGAVTFQGSDGTEFVEAASITAYVDGTPGANDMPGRLVFSTTADGASSPTERMRISSAGNVSLGTTTTSGYKLRLEGTGDGSTSYIIVRAGATFDSTATSYAAGFLTALDVQDTAWTLPVLDHYVANQSAFGSATVTSQYGFKVQSSLTGATNNYGFWSNIADAANRYNFYAAGTAANYFAGKIASLGSYNDTTASAANVFIASNGDIQRSTSSIRYKTNVETLEQGYADNVIFNARPVWYRSLCEADNGSWSYYGLIAEEVAELDPRLVFWGRPTKEVLQEEAKDAVLDDEGNVVEPAREATYTNVEDTDAELRPEGVQYDRLTVMLIDVVQRQQKAIEALEVKVAALEAQ